MTNPNRIEPNTATVEQEVPNTPGDDLMTRLDVDWPQQEISDQAIELNPEDLAPIDQDDIDVNTLQDLEIKERYENTLTAIGELTQEAQDAHRTSLDRVASDTLDAQEAFLRESEALLAYKERCLAEIEAQFERAQRDASTELEITLAKRKAVAADADRVFHTSKIVIDIIDQEVNEGTARQAQHEEYRDSAINTINFLAKRHAQLLVDLDNAEVKREEYANALSDGEVSRDKLLATRSELTKKELKERSKLAAPYIADLIQDAGFYGDLSEEGALEKILPTITEDRPATAAAIKNLPRSFTAEDSKELADILDELDLNKDELKHNDKVDIMYNKNLVDEYDQKIADIAAELDEIPNEIAAARVRLSFERKVISIEIDNRSAAIEQAAKVAHWIAKGNNGEAKKYNLPKFLVPLMEDVSREKLTLSTNKYDPVPTEVQLPDFEIDPTLLLPFGDYGDYGYLSDTIKRQQTLDQHEKAISGSFERRIIGIIKGGFKRRGQTIELKDIEQK